MGKQLQGIQHSYKGHTIPHLKVYTPKEECMYISLIYLFGCVITFNYVANETGLGQSSYPGQMSHFLRIMWVINGLSYRKLDNLVYIFKNGNRGFRAFVNIRLSLVWRTFVTGCLLIRDYKLTWVLIISNQWVPCDKRCGCMRLDCHSREHNSMLLVFSEIMFAGDYVLKKKNMKGSWTWE